MGGLMVPGYLSVKLPKCPHLKASHLSTGADNIKKYWSRYYQGSQGVVFVLDSASSDEDLEAARNELHSALQHPQLCTLPFLILANHQDKPAARTPNQVITGSIPPPQVRRLPEFIAFWADHKSILVPLLYSVIQTPLELEFFMEKAPLLARFFQCKDIFNGASNSVIILGQENRPPPMVMCCEKALLPLLRQEQN